MGRALFPNPTTIYVLHVSSCGDTMDVFVNAGSKSIDESVSRASEIIGSVQSPLTPVLALR